MSRQVDPLVLLIISLFVRLTLTIKFSYILNHCCLINTEEKPYYGIRIISHIGTLTSGNIIFFIS